MSKQDYTLYPIPKKAARSKRRLMYWCFCQTSNKIRFMQNARELFHKCVHSKTFCVHHSIIHCNRSLQVSCRESRQPGYTPLGPTHTHFNPSPHVYCGVGAVFRRCQLFFNVLGCVLYCIALRYAHTTRRTCTYYSTRPFWFIR